MHWGGAHAQGDRLCEGRVGEWNKAREAGRPVRTIAAVSDVPCHGGKDVRGSTAHKNLQKRELVNEQYIGLIPCLEWN